MQRTLGIILAMMAVMALALGCGGAAATPTSAPAVTPNAVYPVAGTPAPASATVAPLYPVALDGPALVNERCTVCHDTSRIKAAKKSQADWATTVARMKGKGASLNDAETAAVITYLAATFK